MLQRSRQPDVSIVIPARNEAATIEQALHSVLAQAWPLERLEVIVVDNGSSDPTAAAVRRFARLHPELLIRLLREPRLGVSRARNRGARSARGRVLLFLDADSRLAPTMVASVLAHIHRGESAVSLRVVADSTDPLDRAFFFAATWLKERVRVPTQLCAVRRDVFWAVGGSTSSYAWPRTTTSCVGSELRDIPSGSSRKAPSGHRRGDCTVGRCGSDSSSQRCTGCSPSSESVATGHTEAEV